MSGFESPDWYRVSEARLQLRPDLIVRSHDYLGQRWIILSDATSGKVHRLTPAAYALLGRLDGTRSVNDVWSLAVKEMGEVAPTQQSVIDLLSQLHHADLLEGPDRPHLDDLLERRDKDRAQRIKKLAMNPLAMTVPLLDPDRFLKWLARVMSVVPRFVWWGSVLALLAPALLLIPANAEALWARGLEGLLDLENLLLIALIYPVVKAVHEIGHGVVIRSRGGEVHEMGLVFVAFFPIPYVEGSASLGFPSKWDRAAVAAAGVVVELCIAAVAFYLWLSVEPGTVKTLAYNTFIIAGLSTLLINGNPLLKFDGYHVLSDLIEIPNLSKRGNAWWGEMARVHILGTIERDRLPLTAWERAWFIFYPPAAFVYRVFITMTIALMVATSYRAVGIALAVWSLALTLVWPALKVAHKALTDHRIEEAGRRARLGAALAGVGLVAFLIVPLPFRTVSEGIVWLPPEAFLRAEADGVVSDVLVPHGMHLDAGEAVVTLRNTDLSLAVAAAAARFDGARTALAIAQASDRTAIDGARAQVASAGLVLDEAREREAGLAATARVDGRLDLLQAGDLAGRFVREGDLLGHVLPDVPPLIRIAVPQWQAPLVREAAPEVGIRFAHQRGSVFEGRLLRDVPSAERKLPSPALSLEGGGRFATTPPVNGQQGETVSPVFIFDISLITPLSDALPYGLRAYVRFEHPPASIFWRLRWALRHLFLSSFDV